MVHGVDPVSSFFLPKKSNFKVYQNYRTISLISRSRKIMLLNILNWLTSKTKTLFAEEQAGFRYGHSGAVRQLQIHHWETPAIPTWAFKNCIDFNKGWNQNCCFPDKNCHADRSRGQTEQICVNNTQAIFMSQIIRKNYSNVKRYFCIIGKVMIVLNWLFKYEHVNSRSVKLLSTK